MSVLTCFFAYLGIMNHLDGNNAAGTRGEIPVTTHERIEINPKVMGGKPAIRGTRRAPIETVLRKLGTGMTPEAIMSDYPRLTTEDIRAAQAFAADGLAGLRREPR
jgi:uncharacterized protein (DUF433 family)